MRGKPTLALAEFDVRLRAFFLEVYHRREHAETKTPPAADLLKKSAGIPKGSGNPKRDKVGKVSRAKIEEIVQTRLAEVRTRMANDPTLSALTSEERDLSSGEIHALLWALGEDKITADLREAMRGHEHADPARTDRALPGILIHRLQEAPDTDTRAAAAYELGALGIVQAIPSLAAALNDEPLVAEIALHALRQFSDAQLSDAQLDEEVTGKVRAARGK